PDAGCPKRISEPCPLGRADDVHVVDVAGFVLRQFAELAEAELGVARGGFAPAPVPAVELAEEEPQSGRLKLVEPRVRADVRERLLVARAVEPEHSYALGQLLVGRGDESAVTAREQVLGREEAEG